VHAAWNSFLVGVPVLLLHLGVTAALLMLGVSLYIFLAPYRELALVRESNTAASIVLSGQILALAIPLGSMLANSVSVPDIMIWGVVAIIVQFAAIFVMRIVVPGLPKRIASGCVASAIVLATAQIATGLLNAAAFAG
jgi:putative membrane protein